MGKIENIDFLIEYRGTFNPSPVKKLLGLDGNQRSDHLPNWERIRLGRMLQRANYLTPEDILKLRDQIPHEDNPFEKRFCLNHGNCYHDAFGCMHHDHTNPHPSDQPPKDRACKDIPHSY